MLPPRTIARADGDGFTVKSVTLNVTVAVWLNAPLVPVIVSVESSAGVPDPVVIVSVELAPGVIDDGLNVGVAPAGSPLTLKLTAPLNPFAALRLSTYDVLEPDAIVCVDGEVRIVKSGLGASTPYTFRKFENEAMYTLPFTIVGGLYLGHKPMLSRLELMVESHSSFDRSSASKARSTPWWVPWSPSALKGMEDHTIPVPEVSPLAESVRTPPEFPFGAIIELVSRGVVLNFAPLN